MKPTKVSLYAILLAGLFSLGCGRTGTAEKPPAVHRPTPVAEAMNCPADIEIVISEIHKLRGEMATIPPDSPAWRNRDIIVTHRVDQLKACLAQEEKHLETLKGQKELLLQGYAEAIERDRNAKGVK